MSSEVSKMIQLICDEKGLSYDVVMDAVESAMGAAYRKDFGNRMQNIKFSYDPETGDMKAWDVKEVVEDIAEDVADIGETRAGTAAAGRGRRRVRSACRTRASSSQGCRRAQEREPTPRRTPRRPSWRIRRSTVQRAT